MDAELVNKLLVLNREFYSIFARDFSETRSAERLSVEPIKPYLFDGARVLDVGCGNGRLAERLDREGYDLSYLGMDVTPGLIEIANARKPRLQHLAAEFRVGDLSERDWAEVVNESAPFDVALVLAVLHHIPSFDLRRDVLCTVHKLLRPGGILVMSNWEFTRNPRLRKKIAPWHTLGIDERELESGDALLDWKRGGSGYRYVHQLTESEVQALAEESRFEILKQYYGDEELNLWSILRQI